MRPCEIVLQQNDATEKKQRIAEKTAPSAGDYDIHISSFVMQNSQYFHFWQAVHAWAVRVLNKKAGRST